MSDTSDSDRKKLIANWKQDDLKDSWKNVDDFNDVLFYASENGLFFGDKSGQGGNMAEYTQLKNCLSSARQLLENDPPDLIQATDKFQDFSRILNEAERKRGRWWRVNHQYAIFQWLYLTLSLLVLWYVIPRVSLLSSLKLGNSVFWGGLGGVAQGYYWLWQRVSDLKFRNLWWFWVLSLPIGGAIFGGIAYLLINGGIASLSSGTVNESAAVFFAALAGFEWKGFVDYFSNLWSQLKAKSGT